jgi:hypothetical protein
MAVDLLPERVPNYSGLLLYVFLVVLMPSVRCTCASLKSDGVFFCLQTRRESLLKLIHLGGRCPSGGLRLLSRLLARLIRLALRPRAITDCAHTRTDRRTFARVAGDGTDDRSAGCSAHRTLHRGTRGGLLRLLLLLRGLLLLLRGLVRDMERVETGLLSCPVVALRFVLRLLLSTLTGARKGVDLEGRRQRFRTARRADERGLGLCSGEGAGRDD